MWPISVMPMRSGVSAAFQNSAAALIEILPVPGHPEIGNEIGKHIGNPLPRRGISQVRQQRRMSG